MPRPAYVIPLSMLRATLALGIILLLSTGVPAQSTIWNVPSSDVQTRGSLYVESGFAGHLEPFDGGGWRSYGLRTVYGLTNDLEAGVNAWVSDASDSRIAELQPNAKWRLYLDERREVAVSVGGLASIPLARGPEATAAGLVYATAAARLGGEAGPRLTGGGYAMAESGTVRSGAVLGCEQPLGGRVSLFADWMSGTNRFGYAGVGLGITLTSRSAAYVGYSFGNSGAGNNGLDVGVGFSF